MKFSTFLGLGLVLSFLLSTASYACGPKTKCMIGDRHYHIAMPKNHDGKTKIGAVIFAHGYKGTAKGAMRNKNLRRMISDMGLAFIAVKSAGDDWNLPHAPNNSNSDGSKEFAYFDAVIKDSATRFPIDRTKLMVTGFSAGGMMVWNLACARSNTFAGFAPVAGTFWLKPPKTCQAPVANIIHIHGDRDKIVPLSGRKIADTHQGDVKSVLNMYQAYGKFGNPKTQKVQNLTCENRTNPQGDILNFCLFPGGHNFSSAFVEFAWKSFEDAGKL